MELADLGVLLAMAAAAGITGRAIAGYGLGATLAAFGVAFAAASSTAMVSAIAGAPRLLPGADAGFAFGWAAVGALAFVAVPAWLIRRSVARDEATRADQPSSASPSAAASVASQPHARSALRSLSQSRSGS